MSFVSSMERAGFSTGQQMYGGQSRVNRRNDQQNGQEYRQQGQQQQTPWQAGHSYNITCKWEPFRESIMAQWDRVTSRELDEIGPNRSKIAMLIETKYGIASHLVENYLRNYERTLPLI